MNEIFSYKCPECKKNFYGKFCRCGYGYEGKAESESPVERKCEMISAGKSCQNEAWANLGMTWKPKRDFYICLDCFYEEKARQEIL